MMGFSSSKDEATSEGWDTVDKNALQASLFDQSSASVSGEENAVNISMELIKLSDQDDVIIPAPDIPPPPQHHQMSHRMIQATRVLKR
jgi:hypothetical protein